MSALIQSSCQRFTMPPSISHGKAALQALRESARLSEEQFEILWQGLKLAYKGQLYGCSCAAELKEMPCEHVMEFLHDPALFLILKKERELGHRGLDVLAAVGNELAKRSDPKNAAGYRKSKTPRKPTDADPGSLPKKHILEGRIARGESVGREGDVFDYWFHAAPEDREGGGQ